MQYDIEGVAHTHTLTSHSALIESNRKLMEMEKPFAKNTNVNKFFACFKQMDECV